MSGLACRFVTRSDAGTTHPAAIVSAEIRVSLSRRIAKRTLSDMTSRKRNRLIDLALMAMVAVAFAGTATVTLAGRFL